MRILLVDDEIVALNALKKRVDWVKYGFTDVLTAQDAKSARAVLKENRIDLVLCDIEMPGESGLTLVKDIKEQYPGTECVMVTCHADFDYVRMTIKYKVLDYILKPIDYEELDSLLLQFVEEHDRKHQQAKLQQIVEKKSEERGEETTLSKDRLEVVKKYIEDHIQEKIYVEDLANLVHVNEQYFMRIFKRNTGQSVTEYITERRIILASSLLKDSEYSINFIADCAGCENSSYFTKLFKKYTGFTPREYRAQFKKE